MPILTDYLRFSPVSHMLSKIEQTFFLKTFATGVEFVVQYNFITVWHIPWDPMGWDGIEIIFW